MSTGLYYNRNAIRMLLQHGRLHKCHLPLPPNASQPEIGIVLEELDLMELCPYPLEGVEDACRVDIVDCYLAFFVADS